MEIHGRGLRRLILTVALTLASVVAQTNTLDDSLREWVTARNDAKRCEDAWIRYRNTFALANPGSQVVLQLDKLDAEMREFARAGNLKVTPAITASVLAEVAQRRGKGTTRHELLPFLLLLQRGAVDDARLGFMLLEAWGSASVVFDATRARESAQAFGNSLQNARKAKVAPGQPDPVQQLIAFLPVVENTPKSLDWLAKSVQTAADRLGPDQPLQADFLEALRLDDIAAGFQNAVRSGANAKAQRALEAMTRARPNHAAPWLMLAIARASYGSESDAEVALKQWRSRRGPDDSEALARLGYSQIVGDVPLTAIEEAILTSGRKQTWLADKAAVTSKLNTLRSEERGSPGRIDRWKNEIQTYEANIRKVNGSRQPQSDKANYISAYRHEIKVRQGNIERETAAQQRRAGELQFLNGLTTDRPSFTLPGQ